MKKVCVKLKKIQKTKSFGQKKIKLCIKNTCTKIVQRLSKIYPRYFAGGFHPNRAAIKKIIAEGRKENKNINL